MKFLLRQWFLIGLVGVLAAGMIWPAELAPLIERIPRSWLIAGVLFLMALPLPLTQLAATVRNSGPAWLAVAINSGIAPLVGWCASVTMLPPALAAGMIVAAAVPCTLASAAVWTRRGGGNEATVLLVTIVTNLACFVVLPAWMWLLLRADVTLSFGQLSLDLLLRVVLPILAAQILRQVGDLGVWATAQRMPLSIASQVGVLVMLLVGAVASNDALGDTSTSPPTAWHWATLILAVILVHCLLLGIGWKLSGWLGFPYEETLAVALGGSQKTLPVGLEVAAKVGGLAVLPMVTYHVAQLVIDTVLIEKLRRRQHVNSSPNGVATENL